MVTPSVDLGIIFNLMSMSITLRDRMVEESAESWYCLKLRNPLNPI